MDHASCTMLWYWKMSCTVSKRDLGAVLSVSAAISVQLFSQTAGGSKKWLSPVQLFAIFYFPCTLGPSVCPLNFYAIM